MDEIRSRLMSLADEKYRAFSSSLIPELPPERVLGVRMPALRALERELQARGKLCRILDGDNIRTGINANLGFSPADRKENIRRIAEVGKLFVDTGIITLAAFISPTAEMRRMAEQIIGAEDFKEIYVSTPLAECERRDVKGLYAKARRGEISDFTGVSAPFEAPLRPALTLDTSRLSVEECVGRLLALVQTA